MTCESLCIICASNDWSAKIMHESYSAMGRLSRQRRMAVLPMKWTIFKLCMSLSTSRPESLR